MSKKGDVTIIVALIIIVFVFLCNVVYCYGTRDSKVVLVKKLEIKTHKKGSDYLVFTDQGVFKNSDSFWSVKFNSSDVHNQLEEGKYFYIEYYGWRIPFLSYYPNILTCEKHKEN